MIHDMATGWLATWLQDTPVRSLARWRDLYLAGSDSGVWPSDYGLASFREGWSQCCTCIGP